MTNEEKKTVGALRTSGEEMGREITSLKRTIAGQKGRLTQLSEELKKCKAYGREADELLEEKDKFIQSLKLQIYGLQDKLEEYSETVEALKKIKNQHEADLSLPWYKRIFKK